jgi:hypothetical protein
MHKRYHMPAVAERSPRKKINPDHDKSSETEPASQVQNQKDLDQYDALGKELGADVVEIKELYRMMFVDGYSLARFGLNTLLWITLMGLAKGVTQRIPLHKSREAEGDWPKISPAPGGLAHIAIGNENRQNGNGD